MELPSTVELAGERDLTRCAREVARIVFGAVGDSGDLVVPPIGSGEFQLQRPSPDRRGPQ